MTVTKEVSARLGSITAKRKEETNMEVSLREADNRERLVRTHVHDAHAGIRVYMYARWIMQPAYFPVCLVGLKA